MMNHIISSEGSPLIKKLVDTALHDRLHDETLDTELDEKYQSLAQKIQIADSMDMRIAAKIADAEAIEKLLDKRTIKAKKDYTEIKANEKELHCSMRYLNGGPDVRILQPRCAYNTHTGFFGPPPLLILLNYSRATRCA